MNIKASGRTALILAAGFWVGICGPVKAGEGAESEVAASQAGAAPAAPVALNKFRKSRHWKHASSHRKSIKVASKTPERSKTSEAKLSQKNNDVESGFKDEEAWSSLPASLANAHAQLADADASPDSATALSSQARDRLQLMAARQSDAAPEPVADGGVVAPDQLNEVDRALGEVKTEDKDRAPAATLAMAAAQAPPAAASADDSAWGQTSLIGRIFIAFGGLLTLASAARMFMT